jgi:hypothetical protein
MKEFIRKWFGWKKAIQRIKDKMKLILINKTNKKFWKTHEVVYSELKDGTKCTGYRKIK